MNRFMWLLSIRKSSSCSHPVEKESRDGNQPIRAAVCGRASSVRILRKDRSGDCEDRQCAPRYATPSSGNALTVSIVPFPGQFSSA
jgi:hypothetical protein